MEEQELEQVKKDISDLYGLIKEVNKKIRDLELRISFRTQAANTPRGGLSDPPDPTVRNNQPSRLGKSLGDWYDSLSNKTSYPIVRPPEEG